MKLEGRFPVAPIFGFYRTFLEKTKHLGFQPTFKTADCQNNIHTTSVNDITVPNINLCPLFSNVYS